MSNKLERNMGYVVKVVKENPGELGLFSLTIKTRLEHNYEEPLGLKDAQDAIKAAEENGLIYTKQHPIFPLREKQVYYPKEEGK